MHFIVSSRGQPVGTTDLGFQVLFPGHRMGWRRPNAHGEKVLRVVATVLPALRACAHHIEEHASEGTQTAQSRSEKATLLADLAAAMQHVEALELTLHGEDGSLIPTKHVDVKDMDQLLELGRSAELATEFDEGDVEEPVAPPSELEPLDAISTMFLDGDAFRPWTPADDEEPEFPRYQVHVTFRDDHSRP